MAILSRDCTALSDILETMHPSRIFFFNCEQILLIHIILIATFLEIYVWFMLFFLFLGTGKSVTGAHIAYILAMLNQHSLSNHKCVFYCGPSNKSVDVVLGKKNYENM